MSDDVLYRCIDELQKVVSLYISIIFNTERLP